MYDSIQLSTEREQLAHRIIFDVQSPDAPFSVPVGDEDEGLAVRRPDGQPVDIGVRGEADRAGAIHIDRELENQGCRVLVDGKYLGSDALPCSSARSLFQSGLCSLT